jgi:rubrerythrin
VKSILFIGIILAWLGSLVYVGNYQYQAGSIAKNAEWQEKENKELKLANKAIVDLRNKLALAEKEKSTQLTVAATTYQEKENAAKEIHQKNLNALRANLLRMYDPGTRSEPTNRQSTASTAAATNSSDGAKNTELSREASDFLLDLTYEADEVTRQLGLCQSTITTYLIPVAE